MKNLSAPAFQQAARTWWATLVPYLLLPVLLTLPGRGWAQAPPWQLAVSGAQTGPDHSVILASAVDTRGNVFVTGYFNGAVGFGSTQLVSAGSTNLFVAKWDATAQAFTWAVSGGGPGASAGRGIAVSNAGVYVTGYFNGPITIAGQALTGAGGTDLFVAKYVDTSTGSTPAASSFAAGWAISAGGSSYDVGNDIAVSGTGVFVTGAFNTETRIAGQTLISSGQNDNEAFVAKYLDMGSAAANGWATRAGGTGDDQSRSIAVSGRGVFVTGSFMGSATIAGQNLPWAGGADMFVAKYVDTSTSNTSATSSFADGWVATGVSVGNEIGMGIAVSGTSVYVTGAFNSSVNLAGRTLTGISTEMFVAKYCDTSTGNTTATSHFANGWAASGGGSTSDLGFDIAVSGTSVYVTGLFTNSATIAGQVLTAAGKEDVFLAKYLDASTSCVPAVGSFANGWASAAGGTGSDAGAGVVVSGQHVYVAGYAIPPATFGLITVGQTSNDWLGFLARLGDPALPAVVQASALNRTALRVVPNPARESFVLTMPAGAGLVGTATLLNALGQVVSTRPLSLTAEGARATFSTHGLPAGVYALRVQAGREQATTQVVVE